MYDAIVGKDGPPIILYYGATGVGKSSVLHAGLVPRLEADHRVVYKRRNLERGLLGTLRDALGAGPEADIAACWRAHEQELGKPLQRGKAGRGKAGQVRKRDRSDIAKSGDFSACPCCQ